MGRRGCQAVCENAARSRYVLVAEGDERRELAAGAIRGVVLRRVFVNHLRGPRSFLRSLYFMTYFELGVLPGETVESEVSILIGTKVW